MQFSLLGQQVRQRSVGVEVKHKECFLVFTSDQASFLTDSDGEAYQFFLYLPWGESLASQKVEFSLGSFQFSTPYQFNGKELDGETGLYNYGARYYDPSLSLWMSVDPLADAPNLVSYSPYHYSYNNPINYIDPDGRNPIRVLMAAAKVGKRAYKAYRSTKKAGRRLTSQDLKKIGLDEVMDMADE